MTIEKRLSPPPIFTQDARLFAIYAKERVRSQVAEKCDED